MEKKISLKFGLITLLIAAAAGSRFLPHPPNFTPVTGMALFGAAHFAKKYWAFVIPVIALWLSNVLLDNIFYAQYYDSFQWFSQPYVFVAMIGIVALGLLNLKKVTVGRLVGTSLIASGLFFLVTNFGSWLALPMYSKDFGGLMTAYAAGLPFLLNTVLGDLVYVGLLFGAYELATNRSLILQRT